jgi:hypothetical protein
MLSAMKRNGCREEVLAAFERLESRHGRDVFDRAEVVREVLSMTSNFEQSTVETHITARMCINAPRNHGTVYADLERVRRGQYRRVHS